MSTRGYARLGAGAPVGKHRQFALAALTRLAIAA